jgi:malyl-CoA/(S)-citramalyl-CoA lyase
MQVRRSILSVPGNKEQMFNKAFETNADCIQFDLEDSVSADSKPEARLLLLDFLSNLKDFNKLIALRINSISSSFILDDLTAFEQVILNQIDYLVIPKVETANDVRFIDTYIRCLESKNSIKSNINLDICIESAQALLNINEIASSSNRISALVFGIADFSESVGMDLNSISGHGEDLSNENHSIIDYALNCLSITANAFRLEAIDSPFGDYRNPEMLRKSAVIAYSKGLNAKWAIHPSQVEIINEVFIPSKIMIKNAEMIVELFEKAMSEGRASISFSGKMIDIATYSLAKSTLKKVSNGNC